MRFTLKEVLDFCWEHKRKRCFKGIDKEEVARIIIHASKTGKLFLVEDELGLCGVMVMRTTATYVFVDYLVAIRNGFLTFVKLYEDKYSHLKLKAFRSEKEVTYNPRVLCQPLHRI